MASKRLVQEADEGAAFLSITGGDPDLLKGVDPERVSNANIAAGKAMNTFRSYIQSDKVSWSIVAVPSEAGLKKFFPMPKTPMKQSSGCGMPSLPRLESMKITPLPLGARI